MHFPKGQIVYENLNTAYTQFDALLEDLKSNRFTGYLKVIGWEYEGVLLLDAGGIVNAVDQLESERRSGPVAAETIAAKAREKNNTLTVCRLSSETAQVLGGLSNGIAIYRDLESDFTSLDRLVDKLQAERHTGYIEIRVKEGPDLATIFLRDGKTVECLLLVNDEVCSGPDVLPEILKATAACRTLFTVYRTEAALAHGNGNAVQGNLSRQGALSFWQAVLKQVEATVDDQHGPESFVAAFRRACINRAENYPFLDPFAAEFEYVNGEVKFDGQTSIAGLNEGLCICLLDSLTELTSNSNHTGLMTRLATAAANIKSSHGPLLKETGLASVLPSIFGDAS